MKLPTTIILYFLGSLLSTTFVTTTTALQLRPAASSMQRSNKNIPTTKRLSSHFQASAASSEGGTEQQPWTKKRLHNTAAFRSAALLGVLAAAGASSSSPLGAVLSRQAGATLHLVSFASWFGTVAYTTFVAGITMFNNLPRQTFGKLQAKLFPKYFMLSNIAIILQLITLSSLPQAVAIKSTKALTVALIMTCLNQFYLEPTSTNNMMERYHLEGLPGGEQSEQYKKLKASFGKFHGMSSLANLIAFCGGMAHAAYLAALLV